MVGQRDLDNRSTSVDAGNRRYRTSDFLSGLAVILSSLAFLMSGFTAYQVAGLRGEIALMRNSLSNPSTAPAASTPVPNSVGGSNTVPNSAPVESTPVSPNAPPAP